MGEGDTGVELASGIGQGRVVFTTGGIDEIFFNWLWLVPVAAILALLVAGRLVTAPRRNYIILKLLLLLLALLTLYPFGALFVAASQVTLVDGISLIAFGFWVSLVGDVLVIFSAFFSG